MRFPVHDVDTAPEGAKDTLAAAQKGYGFIPNLLGVMANAPALVAAYVTLANLFEQTSLTATERQVVLLTSSYENNCGYCVAAHSALASMQKVPQDVVDAIRAGRPIADAKLEALRVFTRIVVESRGWASEAEVETFIAAGYGRQQVMEVVLGVGIKTISNYTTHIAKTPLDSAFSAVAWTKAA